MALSESFVRRVTSTDTAKRFRTEVYRFDGDGPAPAWYVENDGKLRRLNVGSRNVLTIFKTALKNTAPSLLTFQSCALRQIKPCLMDFSSDL